MKHRIPLFGAMVGLCAPVVSCALDVPSEEPGASSLSSQSYALQPMTSLLADAYTVQTQSGSNFGSSSSLLADGSPATRGYLKFDVSGVAAAVSRASLRLYVRNPSGDGPAVHQVDDHWTEHGLTWASRPARIGAALDDLGAIASGTWVEYDVTDAIAGEGRYAFELTSSSGDGAAFHSREGSNAPQLIVETAPDAPAPVESVTVTLLPGHGAGSSERVSFAIPLAPGVLSDADQVRVRRAGTELATARRALAYHPDGSVRSVQLQLQVAVGAGTEIEVRLGESPTLPALSQVSVASTLASADGTLGPRVWALLPAGYLAASGVVGPILPADSLTGAAAAWLELCDYDRYDADAFAALSGTRAAWLYDRVTTHYRGYAVRGDLVPLATAYREAHMYRNGITGTGSSTRIGVPGASGDLKYHYTQGMAIHYLLTGDDRFRESVEDVATRIRGLWSSPEYAGGSDFWTERHAGFALLGYVWAAMVSDDEAAYFAGEADAAVDAYLGGQDGLPSSWTDTAARCFAHRADSHGEGGATWGCSPWMSAILAEALDVYATERGGDDGVRARAAIVKLGRLLARDGRDGGGKPYYWMGLGSDPHQVDLYDEHWGEPAYAIALAWHHQGRTDSTLRSAALALIDGLAAHGSAPHLRSFTWQCRAAVATPYYLQ